MCYTVAMEIMGPSPDIQSLHFALQLHFGDLESLASVAELLQCDPTDILQGMLDAHFAAIADIAVGKADPLTVVLMKRLVDKSIRQNPKFDLICDVCEKKSYAYSLPSDDMIAICGQCIMTKKRELGEKGFIEWAREKYNEKNRWIRTSPL